MGKGPDVTYFIELFAPQDVAKKPKSPEKKVFAGHVGSVHVGGRCQ